MDKSNWFESFEEAYADCPTQDNEGYVPERGSFKCGHSAAWSQRQKEIDRLRAALEQIAKENPHNFDAIPESWIFIAREALGVKSDNI